MSVVDLIMTRRLKLIPPLPSHQADILVDLLAEILVLDFQADRKNTVGSPPQTNRTLTHHTPCAVQTDLLDCE